MKGPSFFAMPWDTVVFLTITTVGFGFSLQKLRYPTEAQGISIASENDDPLLSVNSQGPTLVDLGCLERRIGKEKVTGNLGSVKFKGKFCNLSRRAMKAFGGVELKNLSNGFESTLFFRGRESAFLSERVPLNKGKNVIRLVWRETDKSDPREFLTEVYED